MSQMQRRANRRSITGALIYPPTLIVVTLEDGEEGFLELCEEKSFALRLDGRSSNEVQSYFSDLQRLLADHSISRIVIRAGAYSGQYLPAPPAFKIETMLQLVPGLTVEIIPTVSVTAWVNREDPCLPQPTGRYGKNRWLTAEAKAIEVAAFAAQYAGDPRYFPENEKLLVSRIGHPSSLSVAGASLPNLVPTAVKGASNG